MTFSAASASGEHDSWQGSGTWLVVDDDPSIVRLASQMLKRLGLAVVTACDGAEAVELLPSHPEVTGVLLDLAMPRLDGAATFGAIRRMRPGIPVVLATGCTDERVTRMRSDGLSGYLAKPFGLSDLRRVVRDAIEPRQPDASPAS